MGGQRDGLGQAVVADVDGNPQRAAGGPAPALGQGHPLVQAQRGELAGRPSHEHAANSRFEEETRLLVDHLEVKPAIGIERRVGGGDQSGQGSRHVQSSMVYLGNEVLLGRDLRWTTRVRIHFFSLADLSLVGHWRDSATGMIGRPEPKNRRNQT